MILPDFWRICFPEAELRTVRAVRKLRTGTTQFSDTRIKITTNIRISDSRA